MTRVVVVVVIMGVIVVMDTNVYTMLTLPTGPEP
jgi:hypothetical protein